MKLSELKTLMKDNNIKEINHLNKHEITQRLIRHKLLPEDYDDMYSGVNVKEENVNYRVRTNPRSVEILDRDTGKIVTFPSMYKAGRYFDQAAGLFDAYDGKIWRNMYEIKVFPKRVLKI